MSHRVEQQWRRKNLLTLLLLPLSWLFCTLVAVRRLAYEKGWKRSCRLSVPVVVIGNITVGGTGKTPFTVWLANLLKENGYTPGIVSRGYGRKSRQPIVLVDVNSDPDVTGDEPLLLARKTGCPVAISGDRVAAAKNLISATDCNIILADDGLQHLRLHRDLECALVDGERRFGNGFCLPAGPLREKPARLDNVDFVVVNGGSEKQGYSIKLAGNKVWPVAGSGEVKSLSEFAGIPVHTVAGIGNPERFFNSMRSEGLDIIEHPFPDHWRFRPVDLQFEDDYPVIMTEKDAVKCEKFALENCWYLPVIAEVDSDLAEQILIKLGDLK